MINRVLHGNWIHGNPKGMPGSQVPEFHVLESYVHFFWGAIFVRVIGHQPSRLCPSLRGWGGLSGTACVVEK